MAGLRIEGTEAEITEILSRLRHVITITIPTIFDSRQTLGQKLCYLRCYLDVKDTLLDQLEAANRTIEDLDQEVAELLLQIDKLRQRLDSEPKPGPYDAVLGNSHRRNFTSKE